MYLKKKKIVCIIVLLIFLSFYEFKASYYNRDLLGIFKPILPYDFDLSYNDNLCIYDDLGYGIIIENNSFPLNKISSKLNNFKAIFIQNIISYNVNENIINIIVQTDFKIKIIEILKYGGDGVITNFKVLEQKEFPDMSKNDCYYLNEIPLFFRFGKIISLLIILMVVYVCFKK